MTAVLAYLDILFHFYENVIILELFLILYYSQDYSNIFNLSLNTERHFHQMLFGTAITSQCNNFNGERCGGQVRYTLYEGIMLYDVLHEESGKTLVRLINYLTMWGHAFSCFLTSPTVSPLYGFSYN